jgi:hypothetical protein
MQKNAHYAQLVAQEPRAELLRRQPPSTLLPGVEPSPENLAALARA